MKMNIYDLKVSYSELSEVGKPDEGYNAKLDLKAC